MRARTALVGLMVTIALLSAAVTVPAQDAGDGDVPLDPATAGELSFANVSYQIQTLREGGANPERGLDAGISGTLEIVLTAGDWTVEPAPQDGGNQTADGNETADGEAPAGNETAEDEDTLPVTLQVQVQPPEHVTFPGEVTRSVTLESGQEEPVTLRFPFTVGEDAAEAVADFQVTFTDADDTTQSDVVTHTVRVVPSAPEPTSPVLLIGAGAAVLLLGAGGAYAIAKRRRPKPQPRSATLQRMELERRAERARSDEERAQVQQEIKQQEAQKAQAREVQILIAKRKDVERMLELIKKRHEAGQLSKLQYEKMMEKKMTELDKLNEEITAMEAGDLGR